MGLDYPAIWAGLIAFAVLAYILFDGFDLGIGILSPFFDARGRDQMMNSVAPVWDGNETWLVLGGGGLMAAFPLAYAVMLPALYAPLTAMLLGLIFRGVAFEFRWRAERARWLWEVAFAGGSILAALAQGIVLGAILQGIPVAGRAYAGGWWNWLSWFSVLTGVALVIGYALLGATWLVMKTAGPTQARAVTLASITGLATLALIGLISLITPFLNPVYMERWFAWPALLYSLPVPVLVALAAGALFLGLRKGDETLPFFAAEALFVLCYLGLGISFHDDIVPPAITIRAAAAPDASLKFLLIGSVLLMPLILGYTELAYWVFRGKVDAAAGYHE